MKQEGVDMEETNAVNQERGELAELLRKHRDEVERRCLRQVDVRLNRHELSETELRDSIPDYLVSIAEQLRREDDNPLMQRGIHAWTTLAREHALTRIRLGFDVDEVVQE